MIELSRRGFLRALGCAAVAAAVPEALDEARIASPLMPGYDGEWLEFNCGALTAGRGYTFTAMVKKGGEWLGLGVYGINATGGETKVRIPVPSGGHLYAPTLTAGGLTVEYKPMKHDFRYGTLLPNVRRGKEMLRLPHGPVPRRKWAANV